MLFSRFCFAPDPQGVELVRKELPGLYEALMLAVPSLESIPVETVKEFFSTWTIEDVQFFKERNRAFLENANPSEGLPEHPVTLEINHGAQVLGSFGEVHGNGLARAAVIDLRFQYPGITFMDEAKYGELNPQGNKHDGLIYRIVDGRLELIRVVESKMGGATYEKRQAEGYLKRWQNPQIGITVTDASGAPVHFSADKISLLQPDGNFVAIKDVEIKQLKQATILVGSRNRDVISRQEFAYYGRVPFSASTLREATMNYAKILIGGRATKPEPVIEIKETSGPIFVHVDVPKPRIHDPAKPPQPKVIFAAETYNEVLQDWVLEHHEFPKAGGIADMDPDSKEIDPAASKLEKTLAKVVALDGGQAVAYISRLDNPSRFMLFLHKKMPIQAGLKKALLNSKVSKNSLSALAFYILTYENPPTSDERLTTARAKMEAAITSGATGAEFEAARKEFLAAFRAKQDGPLLEGTLEFLKTVTDPKMDQIDYELALGKYLQTRSLQQGQDWSQVPILKELAEKGHVSWKKYFERRPDHLYLTSHYRESMHECLLRYREMFLELVRK